MQDPVIEWRPVPGFEGLYKVSNDGRVLSLERTCLHYRGVRRVRQKELKATVHREKERVVSHTVSLKDTERGVRTVCSIGKLVLLTFVGPPPSPNHVAHFKDRDPTNSRLTNMEWTTVGVISTQQHRRKREETLRT